MFNDDPLFIKIVKANIHPSNRWKVFRLREIELAKVAELSTEEKKKKDKEDAFHFSRTLLHRANEQSSKFTS
jgi:hypothetical protein